MRKYLWILRMSFLGNLVYATNAFSWALVAVIEIVVPLGIWISATPIGSTFGGFTRLQLLAYYGLMTLVGNFTFWWVNFSIEEDIRSGDLSNMLTKPMSYLGYATLNVLGDKFIAFLIRSPIFIGVFVLFGRVIFSQLTTPNALLAFLGAIMGSLVYLFISVCFGLISFWVTSSRGFFSIYFVAVYLFSGQLAPLSFYPTWFYQLANLLPYRYTLSFPIEIMLGKLNSGQILNGMLIGMAWMVSLGLLAHYLWRKGSSLYQAYGK